MTRLLQVDICEGQLQIDVPLLFVGGRLHSPALRHTIKHALVYFVLITTSTVQAVCLRVAKVSNRLDQPLQVAMKLFKQLGREQFLLWAVCTLELQALAAEGGPSGSGARMLQLAEALLRKKMGLAGLEGLECEASWHAHPVLVR